MKIHNVTIHNFTKLDCIDFVSPNAYWNRVAARPDEPLIEATITIQLSHREYQELLTKNQANEKPSIPS
jgi:hypothetical protein